MGRIAVPTSMPLPDLPARDRLEAIVSRETLADLDAYVELLQRWQARINLIGPASVAQIWERHIEDSLVLSAHLDALGPEKTGVIADMGAGAGLPGIPLALHFRANQSIFVHLIDSNIKKAAFLREALRALSLDGAVHHCRLEAVGPDTLSPNPQIILARALAPLHALSEYARPWLENGAIGLFLKGRHVENELAETVHDDELQYNTVSLDDLTGSSLVIVRKQEAQEQPNG